MTLYQLTSDFQQLVDLAADATDPAEVQAFADTLEGIGGEIDTKVLNCAAVIKTLAGQRDAIDAEQKRLGQRKAAIDNAVDRMKAYMQGGMETAGRDKIKGDLFTISIQNNPPKVVIDNDAAIPVAFTKTVTTPQVSEIGKALKLGTEVPGAHLEHTRGLRIR